MNDKIKNLWDKRNGLVAAHRQFNDAVGDNAMTGEQLSEHRARAEEIRGLEEQIKLERELDGFESFDPEKENEEVRSGVRGQLSEDEGKPERRAAHDDGDYRKAFNRWIRGMAMTPEQRSSLNRGFTADADYRADYTGGDNVTGGYTIPTTFEREIIQKIEAVPAIFDTRAQVIDTGGGGPILIPVVTANLDIIAQQVNEGDAIPFGAAQLAQKQLGAFTYAGGSKVSIQLLQDSFFDIEQFISDQLGYDMGRKIARVLTQGSGGGAEPEGIFTGAATGVTSALANAITADELLALKYSVLPQFRRNGEWLLADSSVLAIRLLKDNQGRYIWQEGLTAGDPDRLLGQPIHVDAFTDEMTAGAKVAAYGDFYQGFLIRRVKPFTLMKLDQLFMTQLMVGYACWSRYDSIVTNAQAVKTLTMHA